MKSSTTLGRVLIALMTIATQALTAASTFASPVRPELTSLVGGEVVISSSIPPNRYFETVPLFFTNDASMATADLSGCHFSNVRGPIYPGVLKIQAVEAVEIVDTEGGRHVGQFAAIKFSNSPVQLNCTRARGTLLNIVETLPTVSDIHNALSESKGVVRLR